MDDLLTTTFRYPKDRHWQFKAVMHKKRTKMNITCSTLIDRFIEDYQDEEKMGDILESVKGSNKKNYEDWESLKRRANLDV